jgi:hypothetical protein
MGKQCWERPNAYLHQTRLLDIRAFAEQQVATEKKSVSQVGEQKVATVKKSVSQTVLGFGKHKLTTTCGRYRRRATWAGRRSDRLRQEDTLRRCVP